MTEKLKADVFAELIEEKSLHEISNLMEESHKSKLIIGTCNIDDYILLFIFNDLSIMCINKYRPDEALSFHISKLNKYKSSLPPELRKIVDEIVDKSLTLFKAKNTKDVHDKKT